MAHLHSHIVFIALVFLLAGTVKGMVGMGLPAVAMGLLGLWMSPAEAAALLALPSLVTNLQQACGRHTRVLLARLWPMLACLAAATWLGAGVITGHDSTLASAGLGILLMVYAAFGLGQWQFTVPPGAERWTGPLAGALTGVLTGATGVFVLPSLPYLVALGLQRDALLQALGLCFGTGTLALAAALAWHGAFAVEALGPSLLALLPTALGMLLGNHLRNRISATLFRRVFFLTLLGLGGHILWQALR